MGSKEGPKSFKRGITSEVTSGLVLACQVFLRQVEQCVCVAEPSGGLGRLS